jgi:hypothetical protein
VPAQVWPVKQPALLVHALRQVLSTVRHASPAAQVPAAPQTDSTGSWQTATPFAVTQRPPLAQSVDDVHAWWQLPNLHRSELAQSLLRVHATPTPAPAAPSLPAPCVSWHVPLMQVWVARGQRPPVQTFTQVLLTQTNGEGHAFPLAPQAGSTQTPLPSAAATHCSPVVQSRDWTHCWWQVANLHASGLLQSLFWTHVPPRSSFLELALHEAATMATRQTLMSKLDRFILSSLDWLGGRVCHKTEL